jgi:LCP family protein required for cell wall assembly
VLRSHRVRHAVALTLTGALCFAGAGAATAYVRLQTSLKPSSDVDAFLADRTDRPTLAPPDPDDPNAGQAMNILVMGTDYRGDGNSALTGDDAEGHRADTTILIHVSGDRRWVEIVSIPRDSKVDIPSCKLPGGGESRPRHGVKFNEAFAIGAGSDDQLDVTGAAACTIATVEELTGVRITDHVVADMTGVVDVVNAIGGVPMCLPERVWSHESVNLDLPAGRTVLDGTQAINFLRARKGHGMGLELRSDLERIKRQQAFVSSMMRAMLAQGTISDVPRLYRVAEAALRSISTNPELGSVASLAGLGWSLRGIDPNNIVFTPLPVVDVDNMVGWVRSETDPIWARIAAGDPPPGVAPADAGGTGDAGSADGAATDTTTPGGAAPDPGAGANQPDGGAGGDANDGSAAREPAPSTPSPTPTLLAGVCE